MGYSDLNGIMESETQLSQYHKTQQYMNKQRKHIYAHVQLKVPKKFSRYSSVLWIQFLQLQNLY